MRYFNHRNQVKSISVTKDQVHWHWLFFIFFFIFRLIYYTYTSILIQFRNEAWQRNGPVVDEIEMIFLVMANRKSKKHSSEDSLEFIMLTTLFTLVTPDPVTLSARREADGISPTNKIVFFFSARCFYLLANSKLIQIILQEYLHEGFMINYVIWIERNIILYNYVNFLQF